MKKFFLLIVTFIWALSGVAWATTYSDFVSGNISVSMPAHTPTDEYVMFMQKRVFDFGDSGFNAGSGVTGGDTVKMFNIPAGTYVMGFGYKVNTASIMSGTSALVGDTGVSDYYVKNNYTGRIPFVDLSKVTTGASIWTFNLYGSQIQSGVSQNGDNLENFHNYGIAGASGVTCYNYKDTINMTLQVDKAFAPGAGYSGVTPVFEAFIWGFRKPTQ